jgi:hypothetical protein
MRLGCVLCASLASSAVKSFIFIRRRGRRLSQPDFAIDDVLDPEFRDRQGDPRLE